MSEVLWWVVWLPAAYLIGSIPTGFVVGRLWRGVDVRTYGSGSSGATNVSRTLGPAAGVAVLLLDMSKGAVAVLVPWLFADSSALTATAGLMAVVGHIFPVFAKFRGGKGVATGLGAVYVFAPWAGLTSTLGIAVAGITKYVSVGSMAGALFGMATVITLIAVGRLDVEYLIFGVGVLLLISIRHVGNMARLLRGTETRFTGAGRPRRVRTRTRHP